MKQLIDRSPCPKISIGVVVLNGVDSLRLLLNSLESQTYSNFEVIVVDGGSTDGTVHLINGYPNLVSKFVSESDGGIYDAMNKVRELANGEWLIFLGCDDLLLIDLNFIAAKLQNKNSVYYGDVILKSKNRKYGGSFTKYKLIMRNICHQSIFYPKHIYKNYAYSNRYKLLADYYYNIILFSFNVEMVYLPVVIAMFNDRGLSSFGDSAFTKDKSSIILKELGFKYYLFAKFFEIVMVFRSFFLFLKIR